jgi:hypothetical protein
MSTQINTYSVERIVMFTGLTKDEDVVQQQMSQKIAKVLNI